MMVVLVVWSCFAACPIVRCVLKLSIGVAQQDSEPIWAYVVGVVGARRGIPGMLIKWKLLLNEMEMDERALLAQSLNHRSLEEEAVRRSLWRA